MAVNRVYGQGNKITPHVKATAQTADRTSNHALSGDPVVIGNLPGVALDDADSDGRTRVQLDGVFELLVAGVDSSGTSGADANVAVNGGDVIYFDPAKTPPLSKRSGGIHFGYAMGDAGTEMLASGTDDEAIQVQVGY